MSPKFRKLNTDIRCYFSWLISMTKMWWPVYYSDKSVEWDVGLSMHHNAPKITHVIAKLAVIQSRIQFNNIVSGGETTPWTNYTPSPFCYMLAWTFPKINTGCIPQNTQQTSDPSLVTAIHSLVTVTSIDRILCKCLP